MAILKCKMCGGDLNLVEGASTAECEFCGVTQTIPKVDDEKKLTLFARANRLRAACEFDKAAGIYEAIVADFPEEAEAYWGLLLCKFGIEYVDDPPTGKKIPTCHRSSFESILDDDNYDQALENASIEAKKLYRQEAKELEEIRKGIVEVSAKEDPYDIFICYKETDPYDQRTLDSSLAYDIYELLTEKGYRVFFSRITLEDKLGVAYEPYIFAALNSAKIMLAFGTDVDYFDAVWVKNEWSRFLKLMAKDRSKHLIPCYKLIDPEDMPKEFRRLQGADMGRIGWEKDLLRGIEKLLPKKKETQTAVKETVVVQQAGGTNANAFVKRGNMALEDKMWDKADGFFEEALNHDAECAEAYVGKFLAQKKQTDLHAWADSLLAQTQHCQGQTEKWSRDNSKEHRLLETYVLEGYGVANRADMQKILNQYQASYSIQSTVRASQLQQARQVFSQDRLLSRAYRFAKGAYADQVNAIQKDVLTKLEDRLARAKQDERGEQKRLAEEYSAHLQKSEEKFAHMRAEAEKVREAQYVRCCKQQEHANLAKDFEQLQQTFQRMGDYKDAKTRAEQCHARYLELQAQEQAELRRIREKQEEERRRAKEEQERKEKRARTRASVITFLVIAAVVAGIGFGVFSFLEARAAKQAEAYAAAESLYASGNLDGAIEAFRELGSYEDAKDCFNTLICEKGQLLIDQGDHVEALSWLFQAGDYAAAKEKRAVAWEHVAVRETVSAGYFWTVGVLNDGTVIAAGEEGEEAIQVSNWENIIAVSAGRYQTIGLKADGTVVAAGKDYHGESKVSGWTDIVSVSAGFNHTVGLKEDGTVVVTGSNSGGDRQIKNWTDIIAVSAGNGFTLGLKADGTIVSAGLGLEITAPIKDWANIVAIDAGWDPNNFVALKKDGTVYPGGYATYDYGATKTDPTEWTGITHISYAWEGIYAINKNGMAKIAQYGFNHNKMLDITSYNSLIAISSGSSHVVAITASGKVVAAGDNKYGQCDVSSWSNIKRPNR